MGKSFGMILIPLILMSAVGIALQVSSAVPSENTQDKRSLIPSPHVSDDSSEPNDNMGEAAALTANVTLANLNVTQSNQDWFMITVNMESVSEKSLFLDMEKAGGNPIFYLIDSNGRVLAGSSEQIPFHRNIGINVYLSETFFIQINDTGGSEFILYNFTAYVFNTHNNTYINQDDRFEDNWGVSVASELGVNTTYTNLLLHPSNYDVYKIHLAKGVNLRIDMEKSCCSPGFQVLNEASVVLATSSEIIPFQRNIIYNTTYTGWHYIRFNPLNATLIYNITITVSDTAFNSGSSSQTGNPSSQTGNSSDLPTLPSYPPLFLIIISSLAILYMRMQKRRI